MWDEAEPIGSSVLYWVKRVSESSDVEGAVNWPVNGVRSIVSDKSRYEEYESDVSCGPNSCFLQVLMSSAVDETVRTMRSWRLCHRNAGSDC